MLTLANLATKLLPLLVRSPQGGTVALVLGLRPKDKSVDAAVWLRGTHGYGAEAFILADGPWHPVLAGAGFNCVYDCVRYPLVYVRFGCAILVFRHRSGFLTLVFRGRGKLTLVAVPFSF